MYLKLQDNTENKNTEESSEEDEYEEDLSDIENEEDPFAVKAIEIA